MNKMEERVIEMVVVFQLMIVLRNRGRKKLMTGNDLIVIAIALPIATGNDMIVAVAVIEIVIEIVLVIWI